MRLRLGVDVAAPAELAWRQLSDLDCWPDWGPTVRSARLDDGTRLLSAGATGSLQTALGPWLPFRVEDWREEAGLCGLLPRRGGDRPAEGPHGAEGLHLSG